MVENIEENISKAASKIATSFVDFDENRLLQDHLDNINFFIFSLDGDLKEWTANDYVPALAEIQENPTASVLSNNQGEFVFRSKEILWHNKPAILVGMITVRRTYALSNPFLKDQYNQQLLPGNVEILKGRSSLPVRYNGQTLFYIQCTGASYYSEGVNLLISVLITILVFGALRIVYHVALWMQEVKKIKTSAFILLGMLAILRTLVMLIDLSSVFGNASIFDPDTFSYNWFYPTLGDGIVNLIFINVFLVFLLFNGQRQFVQRNQVLKYLFGINLILCGYLALYLFADSIQLFQRNEILSLDIASSLAFSHVRIAAFLLTILLSLFFFLIHFLSYRYIRKNFLSDEKVIIVQLYVTLIIFGLAFFNPIFWTVMVVNTIYLIGIYYFKMPDKLSSFRFSSINYLLYSCIILAIVGSAMIYKGEEKKERYGMQRFASFLQLDRDIEGEYLLSDIMNQIQEDEEVKLKITGFKVGQREISTRIERVYLKNYFQDYEFDIYFFDQSGIGISNRYRGQNILKLKNQHATEEYKTAYSNIFYDGSTDHNKRKKYTCFLTIGQGDSSKGFLLVELVLKKFSSKRVLPQLLWNRGITHNGEYDYAFLYDSQFSFTSGDFEYESSFDMDWLESPRIYTKGLEVDGYIHLAVKVGNRITIVSQKTYPNSSLISNFSFLFIILLLIISFSIAVVLLFDRRVKGDLNFSTKIMVYSIASFVLPLVLVAVAVLTTTDQSNKAEIDKSNLKNTFLVAESMDDLLNDYQQSNVSKAELESDINELALHASSDLNVYGADGILISSSTAEIFEKQILSKYINPGVLTALVDQGKESVILNEAIGTFQYKTSYVSINSPDTGKLLGVLASPYFGSKNHVKRQQLQVFGNIINIFTFIFIASIWIAYWVVSKLTSPIVKIAEKLHETGFLDTNQPIEWNTDDEIGKLVSEYNNMLSKLEETKMELARNEKEAAWREMAKQVAHEIKNPLTPMKLTIQHLRRIVGRKPEEKKSLDLLLGQIDTLDDIVTSFSHFAKMPSPQNEGFDICQVLQKSIDLHVDKNINLNQEIDSCIVFGDKKLFGRIFNNLILNAFESMKLVAHPELLVNLSITKKTVEISFKDHGTGISEDIRDKVFVPNFSTKDAGSGIGLAVAKRGIEHAGGKIRFESSSEGTVFYIELPVSKDSTERNS